MVKTNNWLFIAIFITFILLFIFCSQLKKDKIKVKEEDPRLFRKCPLDHYCLDIVTNEKIYPKKGEQVQCKLYNKCLPI